MVVLAGQYQFGDFSKKILKDAKAGLEKAGKDISGNEAYQFGDFTKGLLKRASELDIERMSRGALEKVMSYEFGSITKSILATPSGQKLVDAATEAGKKVSGDPEYKLGDFTKKVAAKLDSAKDRTQRILSLPDEVEVLRQVVQEQQLLISSLSSEAAGPGEEVEVEVVADQKQLPGTAEELKPMVVDNQEVIDVLISSRDDEENK